MFLCIAGKQAEREDKGAVAAKRVGNLAIYRCSASTERCVCVCVCVVCLSSWLEWLVSSLL